MTTKKRHPILPLKSAKGSKRFRSVGVAHWMHPVASVLDACLLQAATPQIKVRKR